MKQQHFTKEKLSLFQKILMSLNICFHNIASIMREWIDKMVKTWNFGGKCFDLFQVAGKK